MCDVTLTRAWWSAIPRFILKKGMAYIVTIPQGTALSKFSVT
jgi:hypothetical protein